MFIITMRTMVTITMATITKLKVITTKLKFTTTMVITMMATIMQLKAMITQPKLTITMLMQVITMRLKHRKLRQMLTITEIIRKKSFLNLTRHRLLV